MKKLRRPTPCLFILMSLAVASCDKRADEDATPACFETLPVGWRVEESRTVPPKRAGEIARELGVPIGSLSNTTLVANGRRLQINIFSVGSPEDALKVHREILLHKKDPAFCIAKGAEVIEFVGDESMGADLPTKAAFELGFRPKPARLRYRIAAKLATVEEVDYMELNKLFNLFLDASSPTRDADINDTAHKMRFGKRLRVRAGPQYQFDPPPIKTTESDGAVTFEFDSLPRDHDIPYVQMITDVETTAEATTNVSAKPGAECLSATAFWPVDSPRIKSLADEIGQQCTSPEEKVNALLAWLAPGQNIAFGGPVTGSRWGVEKVLDQKFGHCWDFADCFVTLCRAQGIPARQVGGWLYGLEGHIWAEVFCEGAGWKQVDATGGARLECGIYHIPYFVSATGDMPILYLERPRIVIADAQ